MNENTDPHPEPEALQPEDSARRGAPRPADAKEAFDDLGEAVKRAWEAGSRDARRAAREALPKARKEFERGIHDFAWGLAYLASFGAGLAREIVPDSVGEGWEKGSEAGSRAARDFAERQRREKETGASGEEPPAEPDTTPVPV